MPDKRYIYITSWIAMIVIGAIAVMALHASGSQAAIGGGGDRGYETGFNDIHMIRMPLDKWSKGINATEWCPVAYRGGNLTWGGCFMYNRKTQTWVGTAPR